MNGLYAITPELTDSDLLIEKVRAVLNAGVRWVQYRNKLGPASLREEQAARLMRLCRLNRSKLIVNDDVNLAQAVDADGVHVGREDCTIGDARQRLGSRKVIGASCYNSLERAQSAERAGANYVAFGSFYRSATKPDAVSASLDLLRQARRTLRISIVAIGGITPERTPEVLAAGAHGIAVSAGLFAGDPSVEAARYLRVIQEDSREP